MKCIKGSSTLKVSLKHEKPSLRIAHAHYNSFLLSIILIFAVLVVLAVLFAWRIIKKAV